MPKANIAGQVRIHKCLNVAAGQYFRGYDQYIRPIHMAAYEARPDLMRLLLTHGASVDAPDKKGRTPVQCVLASTFFDGESLMGKPSKTTARQRLTLQVKTVPTGYLFWLLPSSHGGYIRQTAQLE